MTAQMQPPEAQTKEPALWSLGCLMVLKHSSPEFEAVEAIVPPGYSPPLHRHDFGTESFYILEGRVRFVVGDTDTVHGPGGFAHIPRSTAHSFEVLGDEPARVLNIVTPRKLWDFFVECGEPAAELRVPDEVRIPSDLPAIVGRYDGRVLGPPLNLARRDR
jgi:quercetin dioxygenase-like cupin family protein